MTTPRATPPSIEQRTTMRGIAESYLTDPDWGDLMRHLLALDDALTAADHLAQAAHLMLALSEHAVIEETIEEWGVRYAPGTSDLGVRWDPGHQPYTEAEARRDARTNNLPLVRRTRTRYQDRETPWVEVPTDDSA